MDKLRRGLRYLHQARRFLIRDFKVALDDKDCNTAIRRAQESAEFAVKGALLLLGIDPPKTHQVILNFGGTGKRLPLVTIAWSDDPKNRSPFYLLRRWNGGFELIKVVGWIYTSLAQYSAEAEKETAVGLEIDDRGVRVLRDQKETISLTDVSGVRKSRWLAVPLSRMDRKIVSNHVTKLAMQRDNVYYLDVEVSEQEARLAGLQAKRVLEIILGNMGTDA